MNRPSRDNEPVLPYLPFWINVDDPPAAAACLSKGRLHTKIPAGSGRGEALGTCVCRPVRSLALWQLAPGTMFSQILLFAALLAIRATGGALERSGNVAAWIILGCSRLFGMTVPWRQMVQCPWHGMLSQAELVSDEVANVADPDKCLRAGECSRRKGHGVFGEESAARD